TTFPHLRECGVTSEEFIWLSGELKRDRWLRRQEDAKRKKKEAMDRMEQQKHDLIKRLIHHERNDILNEVQRIMDGSKEEGEDGQ
ncbi:MAG: hypothetical protein PHU03_07305, partial [Syntrophales bacterium]|nr:hypothetical protein [Syntrophales bacterium]